MFNSWLIVVPARLASTRLPEKPLADLVGKSLIVRVVENLAPLREMGATIVVATDSQKITDICKKAGIESMMTAESHVSGTDRCHEVSQKYEHKYVMNVQGDEPFADIESLQNLMRMFENSHFEMGTLAFHRSDIGNYTNTNAVKVVFDINNKALYFSRSPIPYVRDEKVESWWQHQGVYVFKKMTLDQFVKFDVSRLEHYEKLEQLRALENGMSILVVAARKESIGIDTQEDLEKARKYIEEYQKGDP